MVRARAGFFIEVDDFNGEPDIPVTPEHGGQEFVEFHHTQDACLDSCLQKMGPDAWSRCLAPQVRPCRGMRLGRCCAAVGVIGVMGPVWRVRRVLVGRGEPVVCREALLLAGSSKCVIRFWALQFYAGDIGPRWFALNSRFDS